MTVLINKPDMTEKLSYVIGEKKNSKQKCKEIGNMKEKLRNMEYRSKRSNIYLFSEGEKRTTKKPIGYDEKEIIKK